MRGALTRFTFGMWLVAAAPLAAQTSGVSVRLTGRMQFQFNTTSVSADDIGSTDDGAVVGSTFETRRVRLAANLTINDWITGMIEPDFALGRLQIRQAWMNLALDPAFELRMGQFKKPFSLIQLTSSLETAPIERALRILELGDAYAFADGQLDGTPTLGSFLGETVVGEEQALLDQFRYSGYDMGVTAHGHAGGFDYDVGFFNGAGADRRDDGDGKSAVGRLRWTAPTSLPLRLGAGATRHDLRVAADVVKGWAYEVDLEAGAFRREGVHLLAEAVVGDNLGVDERFVGAQGIVSLFKPLAGGRIDGIEPLGRISWADPDRTVTGDAGLLLTPGLNLYFEGRNRLQFNWDVFVPSGDRFDTKHAFRAQAQLAF